MGWYLIYSKSDDYGACNYGLIKCNKKMLKHVYSFREVDKEDVEVLKKYIDVVTDFLDENDSLEEYLEEYFG